MTPILLPIRVLACAFDEAITAEINKPEAAHFRRWWNQPDYAGLLSTNPRDKVWDRLLNTCDLPSPNEEKKSQRSVCISWSPPPGWGRELPDPARTMQSGQARQQAGRDRLPLLPDRWLIVRILRQTHGPFLYDPAKKEFDPKVKFDAAMAKPQVVACVVDSGARYPAEQQDDTLSPRFVVSEAGDFQLMPLGRVRTLQEANGADFARDQVEPLTVRGAQLCPDLAFSAFVPANLNNLSWIDWLEDVDDALLQKSVLSYFVVGWYRSLDRDPLSILQNEGHTDEAIRHALSLFDPPPANKESIPQPAHTARPQVTKSTAPGLVFSNGQSPHVGQRCVMHGMVAHLDFWNPQTYLGPGMGPPTSPPLTTVDAASSSAVAAQPGEEGPSADTHKLQVGLGAMASDALAALISSRQANDATQKAGSAPELYQLLRALLEGGGSFDDLLRWQEKVNAAGAQNQHDRDPRATFQTQRGGTYWVFEPVPNQEQNSQDALRLNDVQRTQLEALNQWQFSVDELSWQLDSAAETLYAALLQMLERQAQHTKAKALFERTENVQDQARMHQAQWALRRYQQFLNRYRKRVEILQGQVETHRKAFQSELERLEGSWRAHFGALIDANAPLLKATEAPPFYVPKEPAVALRDVGARLPRRELLLRGRLEAAIGQRAKKPGKSLKVADLSALLDGFQPPTGSSDKELKGVLAKLGQEACLVEERLAMLIASELKPDWSADGPKRSVDDWKSRVSSLFDAVGGAALPPTFAQQPTSGSDVITACDLAEYALVSGESESRSVETKVVDLAAVWTQQPWVPVFLDWHVNYLPHGSTQSQSLFGRTLLANQPHRRLLKALDSPHPYGDRIAGLLARYKLSLHQAQSWDLTGQSLSGLHQLLLRRNDGLSRPLLKLNSEVGSQAVFELLSRTVQGPPDFDRAQSSAEAATLARLRMRRGSIRIDSLWIVDRFGQAMVRKDPTVFTNERTADGKAVMLEPRFLQPLRVALRFAIPNGTHSPVRGFVVGCPREGSLIIYDKVGKPLGMVLPDGPQKTRWRSARGGDRAKVLTDLRHEDSVLHELVSSLLAEDEKEGPSASDRLRQLLSQIEQGVRRMRPRIAVGGTATAAQLGRPLVLVSAEVRLERRGRDIYLPQGRSALPAVKVEIGSDHADDGVIGFWSGALADNDKPLRTATTGHYAEMPAAVPRTLRSTTEGDGRAAIQLDSGQPTFLTLLMDPTAKIYLKPEHLPTKAVTLESEWFESTLRQLPAVASVAPVLFDSYQTLRAALTHGAEPVSVDLPLPVVPRGGHPDGKATAAPGMLTTMPERGGVLSLLRGSSLTELRVSPGRPLPPLPEGEAAAAEGFLIF